MQADANIVERIAQAYIAHRGVRALSILLVLGSATLLFLLADGFPPFAWRLLVQTLPQIPALVAVRGQAALLALAGLILLSLTILIAWWVLLWLASRMLVYWWYERQELRLFAADAAEAQSLAEGEEEKYAARYPEGDPFEDEENTYADGEEDPYQDGDEEVLWEEQRTAPMPAPSQPFHPIRLMNAPGSSLAYGDQRIIEHASPGTHSDDIQYSSYGRVLPFAFAPAVDASLHNTTNLSNRAPLPVTTSLTQPSVSRQSATQLIVSTGLDVGLQRKGKPNEDSLLALQNTRVLRGCACPVGLFVVADGMGGHENGQEASRLVIQSLSKTVVPSIIYGPTDDNYAELLAEGAHHANLAVYQRNREKKVDMGTTLAAALVVDTTAYVVNAGVSRVYLYRATSGLSQVTRDHSTVARLVENGVIQPEDIYTHPRRNEIYRSLGHHPSEDLDTFILALQPEDLLLLCSDGLWEMVRDAQIQRIIASTLHQPTGISAALVQAALEGGGKDNISVIVVYVKALEDARAAWAG
jgi:serine/threonine protein phosphatase PrpC